VSLGALANYHSLNPGALLLAENPPRPRPSANSSIKLFTLILRYEDEQDFRLSWKDDADNVRQSRSLVRVRRAEIQKQSVNGLAATPCNLHTENPASSELAAQQLNG
jgi:hypothetical protein